MDKDRVIEDRIQEFKERFAQKQETLEQRVERANIPPEIKRGIIQDIKKLNKPLKEITISFIMDSVKRIREFQQNSVERLKDLEESIPPQEVLNFFERAQIEGMVNIDRTTLIKDLRESDEKLLQAIDNLIDSALESMDEVNELVDAKLKEVE